MSLHSPLGYQIPNETARVAHAAFPKGYLYIEDAGRTRPDLRQPSICHLTGAGCIISNLPSCLRLCF